MENEKPLYSNRDLTRLLIPLIIEQLLAVCIGLADTAMVSGLSESAVSAVSLVDSINILLINLFSAMAAGGAVVASQYLGRRDQENAGMAAKQLIHVTLLLSMVLAAAAIVFCNPILNLCFGSLTEKTMKYCRDYFFWSAVSYPFLSVYNSGAALLRACGDSRSSMRISIIMNLTNICGNALLIYAVKLEVAGAAIASLFSRMLAAVLVMRLLLSPSSGIRPTRVFLPEPDFAMIRRIFRLGIPNGVENSMFQIGKILLAGLVSTLGESMIAANAVANSLTGFVCIPGNSVGLAMVTVIGHCVGAGDIRQTRMFTRKLMVIAYSISFFIYASLFLLARPAASLFHLSPEALGACTLILQTYTAVAAVLWPAAFTLPNALRAAGDARYTMTVSMLAMWLCRIASCYLFMYVFHFGLMSIWLAMYLDWVPRVFFFVRRVRGSRWLERTAVD